jgi:hypothetical protein
VREVTNWTVTFLYIYRLLLVTFGMTYVLPLGNYALMPAWASKKFWNWVCGMAFRAAVVLLLMLSYNQNAFLSIFPLSSGTEKVIGG